MSVLQNSLNCISPQSIRWREVQRMWFVTSLIPLFFTKTNRFLNGQITCTELVGQKYYQVNSVSFSVSISIFCTYDRTLRLSASITITSLLYIVNLTRWSSKHEKTVWSSPPTFAQTLTFCTLVCYWAIWWLCYITLQIDDDTSEQIKLLRPWWS